MKCQKCYQQLVQVKSIYACPCGVVYIYEGNILTPNDLLVRLERAGIREEVLAVSDRRTEIAAQKGGKTMKSVEEIIRWQKIAREWRKNGHSERGGPFLSNGEPGVDAKKTPEKDDFRLPSNPSVEGKQKAENE